MKTSEYRSIPKQCPSRFRKLFPALLSVLAVPSLGGNALAADADAHTDLQTDLHSNSNAFHFTTLRGWLYTELLPGDKKSKKFGLEVDSAWGWGNFDVNNISYLEFADYPVAVPGLPAGSSDQVIGAGTGITDTLTAFLFSRKSPHHGRHHFSYGFAAQLPTASDKTLGSGKWAIGPAIDYEYTNGRFYAAFVALHLWDVAGDSSRKSVNYTMIKPMVTYDLNDHWKLVYMPYGISIYWNKLPGDDIYIPLGGGLQYNFDVCGDEMAVSLQAFKYVVRPTKGAEYDIRAMLEYNF